MRVTYLGHSPQGESWEHDRLHEEQCSLKKIVCELFLKPTIFSFFLLPLLIFVLIFFFLGSYLNPYQKSSFFAEFSTSWVKSVQGNLENILDPYIKCPLTALSLL